MNGEQKQIMLWVICKYICICVYMYKCTYPFILYKPISYIFIHVLVIYSEKKLSCWKELEQSLLEKRNAMEATKPSNTAIKLRLSVPKELVVPKKAVKRKSESVGMQPRQVFTGYYSENGSKIRRTVFDGALHIPPATVNLVREAIKSVGGEISNLSTFSEQLPSIGNLLRPSEDPAFANNFLVTELRAGNAGSTLVTARRVVILK
jgi:hypothetical protein